MKIETTAQPLPAVAADWLAVGLFDDEGAGPPPALAGSPLGDLLGRLASNGELGRGVGEVAPIHGDWGLAAGSVAAFGLGPRARFDAGAAFSAGVAVAKRLAGKPRKAVAVALPSSDPAAVSALVEGLVVGTRGPGLRKGEPNRHPFETLILAAEADDPAVVAAVRRGEVVGSAVNFARDAVNTPPAEKDPARLAERYRAEAEAAGVAVEVWGPDRLRAERFGGLLAVGAGSDEPPAFVRLDYRGGGDAPTLALVGKGITFDSGGLSLKPSASMEDMKADMTGSAVVVAAVAAAARLGLKANIAGYVALAENMTGGRAMKLGDVLTMRNGKTVEVLNTDAEGRLVLADALSYAAEHAPARIVDLATLTGACMVALGTRVAGLLANDDATADAVLAACRRSGERAWRLPMDDDYKDLLKSPVADLKNVGGKWGGAITAAKFLEQFVDGRPWAHIDIAGPSWAESDGSTRDVGGTGCFVRTLVALIEAGTPGLDS